MSGFKSKLENFWYHHKWKTIIGTFFAIFIIIMIVQFVSKTEYDMSVLYAGPKHLTPNQVSAVEQAFNAVIDEDYNGDGLDNMELFNLFMMTDEQVNLSKEGKLTGTVEYPNLSELAENKKQFSTQIMSGEALLLLLDPEEYKLVKDGEGLISLSEVADVSGLVLNDEYSIKLSDTGFGKYFELNKILPEDTLLCFRKVSTLSFLKPSGKENERYEYNKRMTKKILEFSEDQIKK